MKLFYSIVWVSYVNVLNFKYLTPSKLMTTKFSGDYENRLEGSVVFNLIYKCSTYNIQ